MGRGELLLSDDMPLNESLAKVALWVAAGATSNGLTRDATIEYVLRLATRALPFSDLEILENLAKTHAFEIATEQMPESDFGDKPEFNHFGPVYNMHRGELGSPVSEHEQERCLAIVRRVLEATSDFSQAGELINDPPNGSLY